MKWGIRGVIEEIGQEKIGGPFLSTFEDEIIATFDTEKQANDYIKKSRLKHPRKEPFAADIVFKNNSLLADCVNATVEIFEKDLPHNPE